MACPLDGDLHGLILDMRVAHTSLRSKVQGDGRARQDNAEVYYMENDPEKEAEAEAQMREVAAIMTGQLFGTLRN